MPPCSDDLAIIANRVTHLLSTQFHLSKRIINLVVSDFGAWCATVHRYDIVQDVDEDRALEIIDRQASIIQFKAALRVAVLYRWARSYAHLCHTQSDIYCYFGILMDSHCHVLKSKTPCHDIHQVYHQGMAPEQCKLSTIVTDMFPMVSENDIKDVWNTFISHNPLPTETVIVTRRKTRKRQAESAMAASDSSLKTQSTSYTHLTEQGYITLPNQLPHIVSPSSLHTSPATVWLTQWKRIVRKGLPRENIPQSIQTKIITALEANNPYVLHMLKVIRKSAYQKGRFLERPKHRFNITHSNMVKFITQQPNNVLHSLIAEYGIRLAENVVPLQSILQANPIYIHHRSIILSNADRIKRTLSTFNCTKMLGTLQSFGMPTAPKLKHLQRTHNISLPSITASDIFYRALTNFEVRQTVSSDKIVLPAAQHSKMPLPQLITLLKQQGPVQRIFAATLIKANITEPDLSIISRGFSHNVSTMVDVDKRLSTMKDALSPGAFAVLRLYLYIVARMTSAHVIKHSNYKKVGFTAYPRAQSFDQHIPAVIVCPHCHTVRSQTTSQNIKRVKEGHNIDTIEFALVCSGCKSRDCRFLDLTDHHIHALSINNMKMPYKFVACQGCGSPTEYRYVIGTDELCQVCYLNVTSTMRAKHCICGEVFTARNPIASFFLAVSDTDKLSAYALCSDHAHITKHVCKPTHPIQYYHNLLSIQQKI